MPFSLFKKPSSSSSSPRRPSTDSTTPLTPIDTTIFPPLPTTHAIIVTLLRDLYPTRFSTISPKDIQQFLSERYSSPPHMPWTWLSLTFSLETIQRALSAYPKSNLAIARNDKGPGWSQRRRLADYIKKTRSEEEERKRACRERKGEDAGDAYEEKEKERMEGDIADLARCVEARRAKERREMEGERRRGEEYVLW